MVPALFSKGVLCSVFVGGGRSPPLSLLFVDLIRLTLYRGCCSTNSLFAYFKLQDVIVQVEKEEKIPFQFKSQCYLLRHKRKSTNSY